MPVVVQIIPSELDPNMDMAELRLCPGLADTLDTEMVVDYLGQMTILRTAQDSVVYRSKDCSYLYQVTERDAKKVVSMEVFYFRVSFTSANIVLL